MIHSGPSGGVHFRAVRISEPEMDWSTMGPGNNHRWPQAARFLHGLVRLCSDVNMS